MTAQPTKYERWHDIDTVVDAQLHESERIGIENVSAFVVFQCGYTPDIFAFDAVGDAHRAVIGACEFIARHSISVGLENVSNLTLGEIMVILATQIDRANGNG